MLLPYINAFENKQTTIGDFEANLYLFRLFQTNSSVTIITKYPKSDVDWQFLTFQFCTKGFNFSIHNINDYAVLMSSNMFNITVYPPLNGEYDVYVLRKNETLFNSHFQIQNPFERKVNYTSMYCIGDTYLTRWCQFENVCLSKNQLFTFSPYHLQFDDIFLIPGARSPPFDKSNNRFTSENIQVLNNMSTFQFDEIPTQVVSPFFNDYMLWHNLLDFLLPAYWTLTSHYANIKTNKFGKHGNGYGSKINTSNQIFVYDTDKLFLSHDFITLFTDHPLIFSILNKSPKCYKTAYIGLRKTEINPLPKRGNREQLLVQYQIDPYISKGFRNFIINRIYHSDNSKCQPSNDKPRIILLKRKTNTEKRRLINSDQVLNATQELCPFCEIVEMDPSNMNDVDQIKYFCNVSLIIGIHGSGLVHGLWLSQSSKKHPTGIVEFLPYKYTCRDWYKQMSKIAKIHYYAIHTLHLNQSRWDSFHNQTKVLRCQNEIGECERIRCHDFLRDQSIIVDIEQYKTIVSPFFDLLNQSRHMKK